MSPDRKTVQRLHSVLIEEIRGGAPEYLEKPFTVAEIYQSLVPYRTHRDRIGVELNGDYEDALLRLLAGEGDFVQLESDAARERIRREIAASNPNTGIYREFAAVGVRLNPDRIPKDEGRNGGGTGGTEAPDPSLALGAPEEPVKPRPPEPASESVRAPDLLRDVAPPVEDARPRAGGTPVAPVGGEKACPECEVPLPEHGNLRFCPFCGANVFVTPCGECGEVLERSWRFCVACGAPSGN